MKRRAAVCASLHAAAPWTVPWLLVMDRPARGGEPEASVPEHEVKAGYLLRFLEFVDWPASAFEGARSPVVFGIAGAQPLARAFEALVAKRRAEARPIEVRQLKAGEAPADLHVLFVGRGVRAGPLVAATASRPVLVVSEHEEAFRLGSAINFVMVEQRVRFDVAPHRAEARELHISSRLLAVARRVVGST